MRPIDADVSIEKIKSLPIELDAKTIQRCIEVLSNMPSADRPSGEWIKATGMMPPEFHGHHCCSECGNFANMEPPFGNREDLSKFCPRCGARMVREDGEEE